MCTAPEERRLYHVILSDWTELQIHLHSDAKTAAVKLFHCVKLQIPTTAAVHTHRHFSSMTTAAHTQGLLRHQSVAVVCLDAHAEKNPHHLCS